MTRARDLAKFNLDGQAVTINESSADLDFRVESNGEANMLLVDGGNDRVVMSKSSAGATTFPLVITNPPGNSANTAVGLRFVPSNATIGDRTVDIVGSQTSAGGNAMELKFLVSNGDTAVERMRIHAGGVVSFNNGIELGSGLDATAAHTLDDYEEGTWTPRLGASTAGVATPGSNNNGYYTKVGRVVHVTGFLVWSEITTSMSGTLQLQGLPFTVANLTGNSPSQPITRMFNGFTNGSSIPHAFQAAPNTTVADVIGFSGQGGSGQNWTTSITASSSGNIYDINLTYITSD